MRVILNGRAIEADEGVSLRDLITNHHIRPDGVIVVVNDSVVAEGAWIDAVLATDDRIELLSIVAGG